MSLEHAKMPRLIDKLMAVEETPEAPSRKKSVDKKLKDKKKK